MLFFPILERNWKVFDSETKLSLVSTINFDKNALVSVTNQELITLFKQAESKVHTFKIPI